MKKTMLIFGMVLLLLTAACGTGNAALDESPYSAAQKSSDIVMTAAKQEVAPDVESLTLRIENLSDQTYTYGVRFEMETQKDGVWYTLEPKEDIMWIEIACVLEPGGTNEEGVTIRSHYGDLDKGNYRIVKTFTSEEGENIEAFAPFSVV